MLSDYRKPREIDDRDLVFDARPKTAQEAAEAAIQDMKEMPEPMVTYTDDPFESLTVTPTLGGPLVYHSPIDQIASFVRGLTYGEMIELAGEIWECRGDGIEEQGLPETLHRWAKSRQ